jgi:hypothetical protein
LGLLALRSAWGLSSRRTPIPRPAILGMRELAYGLLFAVMVGIAL